MGVRDEIQAAEQSSADRQVLAAKAQRDRFQSLARSLQRDLEDADATIAALRSIDAGNVTVSPWPAPKRKTHNRATALLMLSDWHFDEVVNPAEITGPTGEPLNAYSRKIAAQRLKRTVDGADRVASDLLGWEFDGLVCLLGGDMLSGDIHDELSRTNEGPTIASVEHWADPLASALSTLADRFGKVHVPCVVGNHGRNRRKWHAKNTVLDSFDWLLYRMVYRSLRDDSRITWQIPESVDCYFKVYDHLHLLTHGNQARGGAGIAGLATPLALFDHRKRKRDATMGVTASHTWIGHFHTYLPGSGITVNGSGKATDEFSFQGNFGHEPPAQAFAVITPEHNVTTQLAIYCGDRKTEGW